MTRGFIEKLRSDDVAFVYYSGHGMEIRGENFLVPVDFPSNATELEARDESYSAQQLLRSLEETNARVRLMFLDACRDNPLRPTRSGSGGLGRMDGQGTLIVFATGAGQTADDNLTGANGLFTSYLLKALPTPGVPIDQLIKQVARDVHRVREKQTPAIYGLLYEDFTFVAGKAPVPANTCGDGWAMVKESNDVAVLTAFTQGFGECAAEMRLANLRLKTLERRPTGPISPLLPVAPRIISFTAEPSSIEIGQASMLKWSVANAESVSISPSVGATQVEGSRHVITNSTTTFTLIARGVGGSAESAATVTVRNPQAPETVGKIDTASPRTNPKDGLRYVWIPPGTFQMGCSPADAKCLDNEKPVHVTVTNGFWLGESEVTQAAYQKVMGKNPSHYNGAELPVENLKWDEAKAYCQRVGARLPTEAEWEYAAKGGNSTRPSGVGWHSGNSVSSTHSVKRWEPNGYGLYDMLGNVWEWTHDWYTPNLPGGNDPKGPAAGLERVIRGGGWGTNSWEIRASSRWRYVPSVGLPFIGLRCSWD